MNDPVFDRLRPLVVDKLSVSQSQVTPEAAFIWDMGADSLAMAELSTLPEVRHVSWAPRAPTAAGIGAPRKRGLLLAKCLVGRLP